MKDRAYVINLDDYKEIGTHWTALNANGNDVIYFDNFRVFFICNYSLAAPRPTLGHSQEGSFTNLI